MEEYCTSYCSKYVYFDGSYEQVGPFYSNVRQLSKDCGWKNHKIVLLAILNSLHGELRAFFEPLMMTYSTVHAFLMDVSERFKYLPALNKSLDKIKNLRRKPGESLHDFEKILDDLYKTAKYAPIIERFRDLGEEESFNQGVEQTVVDKYLMNMCPSSAYQIQIRSPKNWHEARTLARKYAQEFQIMDDNLPIKSNCHKYLNQQSDICSSIDSATEIFECKTLMFGEKAEEVNQYSVNFLDQKNQKLENTAKKTKIFQETDEKSVMVPKIKFQNCGVTLSRAIISSVNVEFEKVQEFVNEKLEHRRYQLIFQKLLENPVQCQPPKVEEAISILEKREDEAQETLHEAAQKSEMSLSEANILNDDIETKKAREFIVEHEENQHCHITYEQPREMFIIRQPAIFEKAKIISVEHDKSSHENSHAETLKKADLLESPEFVLDCENALPVHAAEDEQKSHVARTIQAGEHHSLKISRLRTELENSFTARVDRKVETSPILSGLQATQSRTQALCRILLQLKNGRITLNLSQQKTREIETKERSKPNENITLHLGLIASASEFAAIFGIAESANEYLQRLNVLRNLKITLSLNIESTESNVIIFKNRPPREKPPWQSTIERSSYLSTKLQRSIA